MRGVVVGTCANEFTQVEKIALLYGFETNRAKTLLGLRLQFSKLVTLSLFGH